MTFIRALSRWLFKGETEHFSGENGALRWSILVGKQKHNVQKPTTLGGVITGNVSMATWLAILLRDNCTKKKFPSVTYASLRSSLLCSINIGRAVLGNAGGWRGEELARGARARNNGGPRPLRFFNSATRPIIMIQCLLATQAKHGRNGRFSHLFSGCRNSCEK